MVAPMEHQASQTIQDKSADLWVVVHSDHSEKYWDMMGIFLKAYALSFQLRFPFPLTLPCASVATGPELGDYWSPLPAGAPFTNMGWNYLSIPKLQRLHRWSLGMDK